MPLLLAVAVTAVPLTMVPAVPAIAAATPGSGVTSRTIAQTTVDGRDYVLREITIWPGGSTGWHYHDGTLYALVKQGTLTRTLADCATVTHPRGSVVVEQSGPGNVHIGRNLGSTAVVLEALYVNPAGSPLAQDAPSPGCGLG
ncbi:cupin domain-containing protein [Thermomonospora echinospora]|nr:cupin domain-containing protein [Thermomonospora echinospora]